MSEPKFTPGPWGYSAVYDWGMVQSRDGFICQAKDPRAASSEVRSEHRLNKTDPWASNAHLIASAPELYAALDHCASLLTTILDRGELMFSQEHMTQAIDNARAVLANARGEA